MQPSQAKQHAEQLRTTVHALEHRLGLFRLLFREQVRFVFDKAKRKAALCSRRAGKSYCVSTYLLETARRYPGSISVYIALTRLSAKRILWPVLRALDAKEHLGLAFNASELTATLPNGSMVWLAGADDEAQIEKLRGSAYHLVVIDEAASFGPHLAALVDEVIDPALLDHDGTLCMIGTPGAACTGKFHDVTTLPNSGWAVHRWTVLDNPHLRNAREWLKRKRAENKWADDNPVYRREWMGEWVWDSESLVYHYGPKNIVDSMPTDGMIHILGVDLGFNDKTAFQIVSSSISDPTCYIHHGEKVGRLDVTSVANRIRQYQHEWDIQRIVIDCGGLGRMIAEEINTRHGLPVYAAEKTDKLGAIELLNADLLMGRAMVMRGEPVLDEWAIMQWDEDRKKEDPRYPNDLADAAVYAYREAVHWSFRAKPPSLQIGTVEHFEAEERMMEHGEEEGDNLHYGANL